MTANPFEQKASLALPAGSPRRESYLPDVHRPLPADQAAEQALLSCAMQDRTVFLMMSERVTPKTFHLEAHAILWKALIELNEKNKPTDLISITNHVDRMGKLAEVGGAATVTEIYLAAASTASWDHYADICNENFRKRELIRIGTEMVAKAYEPSQDPSALQTSAEDQLRLVTHRGASAVKLGDVLGDRVTEWELAIKTKGQNIIGQLTGIEGWDRATLGFRGKTLHVIAGDAKAGKTTLTIQMVLHPAVSHKTPIGIFSMEMSLESMVDKITCANGRVSLRRLMRGECSPDELGRLTKAINTMMDAPVYIDNEPSMTPSQFRAKAMRMKAEHHVGLIAVDYIQLMDGDDTRKSREQQVNEIGKMLKIVAKELDIPIVAISQLNDDGKLRESRSLKMHADTITKIYADKDQHIVEIEYNRDGPCTKIPCHFNKEEGRFDEIFEPEEPVGSYQYAD